MAQHDFNISNATFPAVRSDINSALTAINTTQSGTSRPSSAVAGTIWLDTTSATTPTLKYYDGADDISLATLDHSANTVNWLDSTVSITGLSSTATGTVLTLTDSANTSTVNLIIDNEKEIRFREATANGTNYVALKAPASVSADLTFTLPVAPTANNQALISSTAGVMSFTPYTFPASDGTSGQALVTNGSGALSFGSSVPEQLVKSMPLASGASYTAGKLASINSSGDIVSLPTVNTFGTTRTNAVATAYNSISDDGSTAVKWSQTSSSTTQSTITITGVAISNSANPTNGGTTVTNQISFRTGASGANSTVDIIPLNNNKFLFQQYGFQPLSTCCGPKYIFDVDTYIVEVNTSTGNCTKGNVVSSSVETGTGITAGFITYEFARITGDIIYRRIKTNGSAIDLTGIVTWTGTTITVTQDTDVAGFSGANGKNTILTSNNILGFGTGASWKTATWTASPVGIGTVSTTTQISDYSSNGNWAKMIAFGSNAPEYVIATYTNTSAVERYITYSVNQTTGALTQVEAGNLSSIENTNASMYVFKDKNSFVAVNGNSSCTLSFTNGTKNTPVSNTPYTLTNVFYNSGDLFYNFSTSGGAPTNTGYTVNAYASNTFNYIGVAKTTDSTSPIDIVTNGVAGGFSGLTAGSVYYATAPLDGTVTTSTASGLLIGKAISATEILLQRSSGQ